MQSKGYSNHQKDQWKAELMSDQTSMENERYKGLHVAVIMDGNGRWATRRSLPRISGHRAGIIAVRRVVERAVARGIGSLTLYAFSSDNWRRPVPEIQGIFRLLRIFLHKEVERLRQHGIRFQVIGRRDRLPKPVLREIEEAEYLTASGHGLRLCIAIDYSSRDAITRAATKVSFTCIKETLPLHDQFRAMLAEALNAEGGDVDLLIRTGGEKRLSDFLLWESAYAELLFTDRMWPEFDETDFDNALEQFLSRERRFGGLPAPSLHTANSAM
jgi:undecaprenyl diphosphate synthase